MVSLLKFSYFATVVTKSNNNNNNNNNNNTIKNVKK